mmetsp:Transcript_22753/g.54469  ORF Transcript_22753/g.54469 Transcript_22753/m.54469 type:complete len:247 (+) Transcript_22753:396-1136(+)
MKKAALLLRLGLLDKGEDLCGGCHVLHVRAHAERFKHPPKVRVNKRLVMGLVEPREVGDSAIERRPVASLDRVAQHEQAAGPKHTRHLRRSRLLGVAWHLMEHVHRHDHIGGGVLHWNGLRRGMEERRRRRTARPRDPAPVVDVVAGGLEVVRRQVESGRPHRGVVVLYEGVEPPGATPNFQKRQVLRIRTGLLEPKVEWYERLPLHGVLPAEEERLRRGLVDGGGLAREPPVCLVVEGGDVVVGV